MGNTQSENDNLSINNTENIDNKDINNENQSYSVLCNKINNVLYEFNPDNPVQFIISYLNENKTELEEKCSHFSNNIKNNKINEKTLKIKKQNQRKQSLDNIPLDILEYIIEYLPISSLIQLSAVSKQFHWFINNQDILYKIYCKLTNTIPQQYSNNNYPLWKLKTIEEVTQVKFISNSLAFPYYIEGQIKDIHETYNNIPSIYNIRWIIIEIINILFEPYNNPFPFKYKDNLLYIPLISDNYIQQYYNIFNIGLKRIFVLDKLSNISKEKREFIESKIPLPIPHIRNILENNRKTEIILSSRWSFEFIKERTNKLSILARYSDIWLNNINIIQKKYGFNINNKICSICGYNILHIAYSDILDNIICFYCKQNEILNNKDIKYIKELELYTKLPNSTLKYIGNTIKDFILEQLLQIFPKIIIELRQEKNVIRENTELRMITYQIYYSIDNNIDIDKNKISILIIHLFPDGNLKSFMVSGDIRYECCNPNGKLYDNSEYIDNEIQSKKIEELLNISFQYISSSEISCLSSSISWSSQWTSCITYSIYKKEYKIEYTGRKKIVILSHINNWIHSQYNIPSYLLRPYKDIEKYIR